MSLSITTRQYSAYSPLWVCFKSGANFLNFESCDIPNVLEELKNIWLSEGQSINDFPGGLQVAIPPTPNNITPIINILNDLTCAICTEIIVDASQANCIHVFCHTCILTWFISGNFDSNCAVCRVRIIRSSQIQRNSFVNNIIVQLFQLTSQDTQTQRAILVQERGILSQRLQQRIQNRPLVIVPPAIVLESASEDEEDWQFG